MPYQIKKVGQYWKLWNIKKKEFVNKNYKSNNPQSIVVLISEDIEKKN